MIEQLLHGTAVFTLALTLGAMVFFAAITAPTVFQALDAEAGGKFLRKIFPRYYLYLAIVSGIAGATVAKEDLYSGLAMLGIAALFVWARQILMPAINAAKDASLAGDAAQEARFNKLHKASVIVNMIQLLILIGVFFKVTL